MTTADPRRFWRSVRSRAALAWELLAHLSGKRRRWLWPLALLMLAAAVLIAFLAYQSPVAPFVYVLF
jgi:hypothetical protein